MKTNVIIKTYNTKLEVIQETNYKFKTKHEASCFKKNFIELSNFEKITQNKNKTFTELTEKNYKTQIIIKRE